MVNPKARILLGLRKGRWFKAILQIENMVLFGNKTKYCGDTPFKTMLIFIKFTVELAAL